MWTMFPKLKSENENAIINEIEKKKHFKTYNTYIKKYIIRVL